MFSKAKTPEPPVDSFASVDAETGCDALLGNITSGRRRSGSSVPGKSEQNDTTNHVRASVEKIEVSRPRGIDGCFHYAPLSARSGARFTSKLRLAPIIALWFFSVVAWTMGAFLKPTLEIQVMPGTSFSSRYKRSLVLTLKDLYDKRTYFACGVLAFFSLVVPISKLISTAWILMRLCCQPVSTVYTAHRWEINVLFFLISYQLTDLYVGVLFVTYFNSDSADSKFLEGFYWFFSYCVSSMVGSVALDSIFAPYFHGVRTATALTEEELSAPQSSQSRSKMEAEVERLEGQESDRASPIIVCICVFMGALCFFTSLAECFAQPFIELRTMYEGVAVDRSAPSLSYMFIEFLPNNLDFCATVTILLMNLVFPIVYVLIVAVESALRACGARPGLLGALALVVESLRTWVTLDVFFLACFVFLFTVQDSKTLTMPVENSWGIYWAFGAAFSLFYVRWLADPTSHLLPGWLDSLPIKVPISTLCLTICMWYFVSFVIIGGQSNSPVVAANHFNFNGLDSVCFNLAPVLNQTIRSALPASFGDCDGSSDSSGADRFVLPPTPCSDSPPLYNEEHGQTYIRALWIGGVNSISVGECELFKDPPMILSHGGPPLVRYHLRLGGEFEKVNMFLHVFQCEGFLGCTHIDSPDHCCGSNIRFNISFALDCIPKAKDPNAFSSVELEEVSLEPMLVETDLLGGHLQVEAIDIAPKVEKVIMDKLSGLIDTQRLSWAGESLGMPDIINRLIAYNSPESAGVC